MTRRAYHLRESRAFARHALGMGGVLVTPTLVRWDLSGNCTDPRFMELTGRLDLSEDFADEKPISTVLEVRCRVCANCLRARAFHWRMKAQAECQHAQRTWFGTLTLSEAEQVKALYRAQLASERRGVPWHSPVKRGLDETPEAYSMRVRRAQFRLAVQSIAPDVTKWLKRIRKESGAKLRFLLVAEAHKSGRPHFHVLVHEVAGSVPIRKRTLGDQWKLGFSQFRLVQEGDKAASYVCKYLTKSAAARVRASLRYGVTT